MLGFAVAAVALLCYARVDLGMTHEQINQTLEQWIGKTSIFAVLIWSQVFVAVLAGVACRIWRLRAENSRAN